MSESLKAKTVRGTVWSAVDNVANQGITFLVGLVLARLLSPHEYGLIGYILIIVAILNSIVDSGFSNALIRKKDVKEIDYNTTFIFNMVISVVMMVLLFFTAPWISKFLNEPELIPLIRFMSVILIINALSIIQRTVLVKRIDFKSQTKVSLIASITSGCVGIGMALGGYGVWSLVGQQLIRQIVNTVFLWLVNKWIPKFRFSWQSFRELFGFGWKLMISQIINVTWKEVYQIVIGKCYSTSTLGQYTRGKQFSDIFSANMTNVIQRVSYPILSSIQDERTRLMEAYRRIIRTSMLMSFVFLFGLGAISDSLIVVLIGNKWLEAAEYLRIVVISASLYPLHAINLNMLQVQGRSDLFLKLEVLKKLIGIIPILLGILIDIKVMLWASVLVGIFDYFLNSYYSGKFIGYSTWAQIKDILPSFCIAAFMAIVVYLVKIVELRPIWTLISQLSVGLFIVIVISELVRLPEYLEIKNIILSCFKNIKVNH